MRNSSNAAGGGHNGNCRDLGEMCGTDCSFVDQPAEFATALREVLTLQSFEDILRCA